MKSSMKRLAKDHVKLRRDLPPNYFFESEDDMDIPDDLTQLSICLTGPEGTPFVAGCWKLRLSIPAEFPQRPPTAAFLTKIFHPNVAEDTGAVCLETLKRDWDPNLTLRDILIHISCLLIQPNPDSALNQKAGVLIQDDYQAFSKQARLMTRIHASIPLQLQQVADEARKRGDDHVQSVEPVLQEAQQTTNTVGNGSPSVRDDKSRKRPLVDNEGRERRRKSPKHHHAQEANDRSLRMAKPDPINAISIPDLGSLTSTKIVFRAQWATPGFVKTRVGLRRL